MDWKLIAFTVTMIVVAGLVAWIRNKIIPLWGLEDSLKEYLHEQKNRQA
jgi:hypothetical protein